VGPVIVEQGSHRTERGVRRRHPHDGQGHRTSLADSRPAPAPHHRDSETSIKSCRPHRGSHEDGRWRGGHWCGRIAVIAPPPGADAA
jgi:hypothetical protein